MLGSIPTGQITSSGTQQHPQVLFIHTDLDGELKNIADPFEKGFPELA